MHRSTTGFAIALASVCGMFCTSVAGGSSRETSAVPDARSPTVAIADAYLATVAREFPEAGTANDLPGTNHGIGHCECIHKATAHGLNIKCHRIAGTDLRLNCAGC